ncbi:phage holin family protein [Methylobacterium sp. J-068]|uniref:phage holin family protein n=1 Tax=Methylobacterium sp. J-068 TaxID=2836649 RepID=UPI001FBB3616|nr:phage holin family protein [Methylobacterium sp. J-068]MCJ2037146.1 phage holin family protein [Methylobacterium sp. J-068]
MGRPTASLRTLISEGLRHGGDLVGQELELMRRETDGNIQAILGLVATFGTALVLVVAAMVMLFVALVKGLAALIGSEILAALIVGSPFAAIALVLTTLGLRRMARSNLLPRRFERQVGKDAALVTERASD